MDAGKRYPVKGKVTEVDPGQKLMTLDHEDIPGYMPAMIMPFPVKDDQMLNRAAPGDEVTASLVITRDNRYWLEDLVVTRRAPEGAPPSARPSPREPEPGQPVPDVALVNQDGKRIRLADYRGRALALTFIYTRCPLPEFCPRMSRNFEAAAKALAAEPALQAGTHLLSISFDPEHDTPEVLKSYGRPFTGEGPRPFAHWEFASGPEAEIRRLGGFLGLDYDPDQGMWVHNLRTAVVGPDGRLVRSIRGSDWKPEDLVAELRGAAAAPKRSEGRRP